MEDALKRLDNLTHEEARMVIAENLRATHAVDERVRGVDDKVTEVIHGVWKSSLVLRNVQPELLRWKGSKTSHRTNGQRRRSSQTFVVSSLGLISTDYTSFQKINCGKTSTNGSPHRIRQLIIISPVKLITRKLQHGSSTETFTRNGNQKDHSFGSTESVRLVLIFHLIPPNGVLTS